MDYATKNHAKFLILYHLIDLVQIPEKLLIPYGDEVKQMFEDIAARSDFAFEATFDRSRPHSLSGEE